MRLSIRLLAIASAVVMSVTTGSSVVAAGAATAPQAIAVHAIQFDYYQPVVGMVGSGSTVHFSPSKATGLTAVSAADCSGANYTFSFANQTSKNQKVTLGGAFFALILVDRVVNFCIASDGIYKFGLRSSPAAKVKLVVTN